MRQIAIYTLFAAALTTTAVEAQAQATTNVTIDHTVQRYLNKGGDKVSSLDREKFFTIHEDTRAVNDAVIKKFMDEYNVGYGRSFEGPLKKLYSTSDNKPNQYPSDLTPSNTTPLATRKWVLSDKTDNGYLNADTDPEKAGQWAAKYFADQYRDLADGKQIIPEFFEPLNEPMIYSPEISSNKIGGVTTNKMTADEVEEMICYYHKYAAKHIKATPALSGMKVVGYGGAYPSFEAPTSKAFDQWNTKMGRFIDIAGAEVDGFSIHLYDGINQVGEESKRSGSNSEAILDMIEAYSFKKLGVVKPHLTSEYGGIDHYSENKTRYSEEYSDLNVASMNHMLYNLLERQDNMLFSVIFITGKGTWYITEANDYETYAAVLFKRLVTGIPLSSADEWGYTGRINLYDLWKDVKGDRIEIKSDNPDIQVAAFKDGATLYITMSNLDDKQQTVKLLNSIDPKSVVRRQMKVAFGVGVTYDETTIPGLPTEITLDPDEGNVFVVELNDVGQYGNELTRTKYYQNSRFLEKATGSMTYTFNGVDLESGYGKASIRMTLGDNKISSLADVTKMFPTAIKVNDTPVAIPSNWRGYDQVARGSFLGMIDVPFDFKNLVDGENKISFTFPGVSDGYLASVILEVETYKNAIPESVIVNGSFESIDLSAWTPWSIFGDAKLDSENASFGSCMQLEGYAGIEQSFELIQGEQYSYTFEAKCEAGSSLCVELLDGDEVVDSQQIKVSEYAAKPFEVTFTAKNSVGSVSISNEGGKAWVDTMSLVLVESNNNKQ